MEASQAVAASTDITESISTVEFGAERELFRSTYDSTRDSTSLAVVAVVAAARGEDLQPLTPLQTVIDTDALDNLMAKSPTGLRSCNSISFRYGGFEITVTNEGVIEAEPVESA